MTKKKLKYPPEFKAEVCEYAKKESIVYASILYNLHRNTIGNWVKKYKKSGIKGFTVVRKDTQKAKLDKITLDNIAKYKRRNPKATLDGIKKRFKLDCHLTLISRKLRKVYSPVKRKKQKETLFLQTKIIRDAVYKGSQHPVFRLSLHLCDGRPMAIGFTSWYSSEKICLFIRYSLEKMKNLKTKRDFKKIFTSTKFIKVEDFKTIISDFYDIELEVVKVENYKLCKKNDIGYSKVNIRNSIIDSYDKILEDYDANELNETLLASLVNVNELNKKQISEKGWDSLFMPSETKKSLFAAIKKMRDKGNQAVLDFDYDTAMNEYHKAYSAMAVLRFEDKEMYLSVLSAKAKLFYNTEKYQTALLLFKDIARISESNKFIKIQADSYYYIALISISFQNISGAVKYFRLSARALEKSSDINLKCMHFRAKYREYLSQGKLKSAEKYSGIYYESALKTRDKEIIGNCLSTKGAYLYRQDSIENFEKVLLEAKEYNLKNGNIYDASKNLTNLISIYSYYLLKEKEEIFKLIDELKIVANKIRMPHLLYESLFRLGIFYYNKNQNDEALEILKRALPGVKRYLDKESYLSAMCYICEIYFYQKKFTNAINIIMPMINESIKVKNNLYTLRGIKYLSSIYIEKNDTKRVVWLVKKGITLSIKQRNYYACASYHKLYAELCEKNKLNKTVRYHYSESLKYFLLFKKENDYDVSKEVDFLKSKLKCCKL